MWWPQLRPERIEWRNLPTPDHVGAGAGVPDWRLAPDATENNLTPATYDYTNGGAAIRVHRGRKEVQEFAALLASPVATVGAKLRAVLVWLQWSPEALVKARNLTRPDDPATVAKRAKAKAKRLEADKIRRRVARATARANHKRVARAKARVAKRIVHPQP